jgi:hypothetical protein
MVLLIGNLVDFELKCDCEYALINGYELISYEPGPGLYNVFNLCELKRIDDELKQALAPLFYSAIVILYVPGPGPLYSFCLIFIM